MDRLDLYCERTAPGLLAEPLNAVSNLAFFLAALWLWRRHAASRARWALVLTLLAIGTGSGLFHTFATRWALWADVLPILVFQLLVLGLYLRRVLTLGAGAVAAGYAAFLLLSLAFGVLPRDWLNGSLGYAAAGLTLFALGLVHWRRHAPARGALLTAAALLALSLAARSTDLSLCAHWPAGTHFLWHLLNAAVLALTGHGLLSALAPGPESESRRS